MKKIFKRIKNHLENNKMFYLEVSMLTLTMLLNSDIALADVDASGQKIYNKIIPIAKWVIIIKGAFEIIQAVINGDLQAAKTKFFSYLLCFTILLALPWSFNEVEGVFK